MILVYAGRRPGSAAFPAANVEFVGEQIEQLLEGLRPRVVVGSAAAGADLLVLGAALRVGAGAHVQLAGTRAAFREGSVADKDPTWGRRFDALLAQRAVTTTEIALAQDAEESYRAVTAELLRKAADVREVGEEIVVLAVSVPRKGVDHTEELVEAQRAAGGLVLRIDPARTAQRTPRAFVAMPFGTKPYLERRWHNYDADLTYRRLLVPALLDAGYRPLRADTDALLEVIDHTMLREIATADVLVADLAMLNPNVMWELGVRHAWRRSGTILIAPDWVRNPFDVARIPVHGYRRGARAFREADLVEAVAHLRKVFAQVDRRADDSPVFASFGSLAEVQLPAARVPTAALPAPGELLAEITLAVDRRRPSELDGLVAKINALALDPATAATLVEQAGYALNALDEHERARKALAPLARADTQHQRRRLQEQYAHALIRSAGAGSATARLKEAQKRVTAVIDVHGPSGETYGLLGSIHKQRVKDALDGARTPAATDLAAAIDAYDEGFRGDPTDFYPGINAIALLRLRGQHLGGPKQDLRRAAELLPVVRFAVERQGTHDGDVWAQLTLAECALHEHLLKGAKRSLKDAGRLYGAAGARADAQQRRSALRQLDLMLAAGDPPAAIEPLRAAFG